MRALGIDPGFASMGFGVIDWVAGTPPHVYDAFVVTTRKGAGKATQDDIRRMQILWLNIEQAIHEYQPDVIGIETYTVFGNPRGRAGKGTGWKALHGYSMSCAMAFKYDIPVLPFMPADLKRRVANNTSATKTDVERALGTRVTGLPEALAGLPSSVHEHAADACGHGLMALADHAQQSGLLQ